MKSLWAMRDAAMRVVWSVWTVWRSILSAIEQSVARHSGHRPKKRKERTMDVDGEERVLTKSVVAPELIVRGSADHTQTTGGAVIPCLSGQKYCNHS